MRFKSFRFTLRECLKIQLDKHPKIILAIKYYIEHSNKLY